MRNLMAGPDAAVCESRARRFNVSLLVRHDFPAVLQLAVDKLNSADVVGTRTPELIPAIQDTGTTLVAFRC